MTQMRLGFENSWRRYLETNDNILCAAVRSAILATAWLLVEQLALFIVDVIERIGRLYSVHDLCSC